MYKRFMVVLLMFVCVSFGKTINKTYSFNTPQIRNGIVFLEGCHVRCQLFAPSVAEKPVVLLLPKGEDAVSVKVEYGTPVLLKGYFELKPFRPGTRLDAPPPDRSYYELRSEVYNENKFFPEQKRTQWFNNQYKHGYTVLYSSINPVQYNPVTGQLRYYPKIKVTVQTEPRREAVHYRCTPAIASEIASMVDNPEAVADLTYTQEDSDDYDYLIVTIDSYKDLWEDFIAFNERRCLKTKIETMTNIANGTGSDIQQKLRNYIKKEYEDHNITYVLMGADHATSASTGIAARLFGCKFWDHDQTQSSNLHEETDIPSEMYYETLDGEWKNAGDPYYGAPGSQDMTFEVYSGRFSIANATHLANMIKKTIGYSESPVADEVKNLFLAGNWLWINNGVNCTGGDNVEEHVGTCTANGYTTIGFPENDWNIERLYEESADEWDVYDIRSGLKSHKPAFLIHDGHGNESYVWCETSTGVREANYPQNSADKGNYFVAITGACLPGRFTIGQCIMEAFERLSTGIVASISNTKSGWGDNDGTDGCTHRPFRYLIDGLFNPEHKMHHLGRLHARGKEANADIVLNTDLNTPPYYYCIVYCIYETVLLGDPALSIWTDTPIEMSDPGYPTPLTGPNFTWNSGYNYAWMALVDAKSGEIVYTQQADKDGKFEINSQNNKALADYIAANPDVDFKIRIKAQNYLPFEGDLPYNPTTIDTKGQYSFVNSINYYGKKAEIRYELPAASLVNIAVYNAKGSIVKNVINECKNAGQHSATFTTNNFPNGVYYCRIDYNNNTAIDKFVVTK